MKILKNLLFKNREKFENKNNSIYFIDRYGEIGKLVKEARIKNNISIKKLSQISKIPESTINSIENNIETIRPEYPFIRSILFKLEECLSLRKNILVGLIIKETRISKREKYKFIVRKLDFINTWEGNILYFMILILTIFILKRYFYSNVNVIETQIIEEIKNE